MQLNTFLVALFTICSLSVPHALAEEHHHHEHGAHSHGSGTLAIAFDNLKGQIEFKAAAFGIVGFEHPAKSVTDKKQLADVISKFESGISKFVSFDPNLSCVFKKEKVDMVPDTDGDNHADFIANFEITCGKPPMSSQLKIDFSTYSKIKDLDITVLIGDVQKSAEFKGKPVVLELK